MAFKQITAIILSLMIFAQIIPISHAENDLANKIEQVKLPEISSSTRFDSQISSSINIIQGLDDARSSNPRLFYGDQLTENARAVYNKLCVLTPKQSSFSVTLPSPLKYDLYSDSVPSSLPNDISKKLSEDLVYIVQSSYDAFMYDCPEIFWVDRLSISYSPAANGESGHYIYSITSLTLKVYVKSHFADTLQSDVEALNNKINSLSLSDSNRYLTVKKINDYLCDNVTYVSDAPRRYDPHGALIDGQSVCEGYAEAFKLMCDKYGVPCILIAGNLYTPTGELIGPHEWNYVQMDDGKWYAVDVTTNDQSYIIYDYLLCGKETEMPHFLNCSYSTTHIASGDINFTGIATFELPELNDEAYVYNVKAEKEAPPAPEVFYVTSSSVTLVSEEGLEYSLGGEAWQSNPEFFSLTPNTTYEFYVRYAETADTYASLPSPATLVTTHKDAPPPPSKPTCVSISDTTVILNAVVGCEYRVNGGEWQNSPVFTGLSPETQYTFVQRIAETEENTASDESVSLVISTKSALPSYYFGTLLSENGKAVYHALSEYDGTYTSVTVTLPQAINYSVNSDTLSELEEKKINGDAVILLSSALDALKYDYPEFFWLHGFSSTTNAVFSNEGGNTYTVVSYTLRFSTEAQFKDNIKESSDLLNSSAEKLNISTSSRYDAVLDIHDKLADIVTFDVDAVNVSNAYGAIVDGLADSLGYAKAFKYLCDINNIPCVIVRGNINYVSGTTAIKCWNYVLMEDGIWYAVDMYRDDQAAMLYHDYLLIGSNTSAVNFGDRTLATSHDPMGNFSDGGFIFTYPELSDIAYVFKAPDVLPDGLTITDDGYLFGIKCETAVSYLNGLEAFSAKGEELGENSLLTTGSTVMLNGQVLTVIIIGDVNGDGKINSTDFMQVRKQYLGLFSMSEYNLIAADVNTDGKINSTDFMQIRKHYLKLFDLYEK